MIKFIGDDLGDIETGNGHQSNLIATTNDRLKKTVIELRLLKDSISSDVGDLGFDINLLEKTIVKLDKKNSILQKTMLALTVVGVIFATAQVIQAVDILRRW